MTVPQVAQALTRGLSSCADADVVEVAEAEAMDRETSAADVARNFLEHVDFGFLSPRDRNRPRAVGRGRLEQAEHSRRSFSGALHLELRFRQRCGRRHGKKKHVRAPPSEASARISARAGRTSTRSFMCVRLFSLATLCLIGLSGMAQTTDGDDKIDKLL